MQELTSSPTLAQIEKLEAELMKFPPAEIPTDHIFGPGFYARTIIIPADTTLTGKVHATEHIFMVTKGDITLATEDGIRRVQAPFQMVCRPGLKRVGYTHSETTCVNIHITHETDLVKLEAELIIAPALPAPLPQGELP